eukprot:CAMPEP_0113398728 /NCGR_PEP_ID=MMETSP0013_2-20120614/15133_1 /TAXON_ID=2843 ORGANISM="Skeletonema costatum, Strain 1716" /NCGR_SAMPLE_ID=MMETSP0013_2 /ASSEMBLY_ACC=CAM_ASM_000158 /LENGTH=61 /DNA_ID=CAMNT_0000283527 /DNA_START=14 /DNA_END=196 /DNA_ORIENTATION=- /assembly_acc=CAM_ASM_000158
MADNPQNRSSASANDEGEIRFNQLLDEQDHNRCKEGNKNALLAEKLERLRALKDELAKDNW